MNELRRTTIVLALATVGLLAGPGTAAAAPSCVGGTLTYRGANEFVKAELGLKNLGESFALEARAGGIGRLQSAATKDLIRECR